MFFMLGIILLSIAIVMLVKGSFTDGVRTIKLRGKAAIPLVLAILLLMTSLVVRVPFGNVGLVKGYAGDILREVDAGTSFKLPWQSVELQSVQKVTNCFDMGGEGASAFTKDTQNVFATICIDTRVTKGDARNVRENIAGDFRVEGGYLHAKVLDAFKRETVGYTALDIAPNREKIREATLESLRPVVEVDGITIDTLQISNISFSTGFENAIEGTATAREEAKREEEQVKVTEAQARQEVARAEGEANAEIQRARGIAEANELIANSLTDELLVLRYYEAINGAGTIITDGNSPVILNQSTSTPAPAAAAAAATTSGVSDPSDR